MTRGTRSNLHQQKSMSRAVPRSNPGACGVLEEKGAAEWPRGALSPTGLGGRVGAAGSSEGVSTPSHPTHAGNPPTRGPAAAGRASRQTWDVRPLSKHSRESFFSLAHVRKSIGSSNPETCIVCTNGRGSRQRAGRVRGRQGRVFLPRAPPCPPRARRSPGCPRTTHNPKNMASARPPGTVARSRSAGFPGVSVHGRGPHRPPSRGIAWL